MSEQNAIRFATIDAACNYFVRDERRILNTKCILSSIRSLDGYIHS